MALNFNKQNKKTNWAIIIGYIVMYLIFTTLLYFILRYFNKIPENWTYFHVMTVTLLIVLIGKLIRWYLL